MERFKKQLSKIRNFPLFYIGATVIIIVSGYLVGSYREIEEYKKITSWYEKLEDKKLKDNSSIELSEFIEKAQDKLDNLISSTLLNTQLQTNDQTGKKINQGLPHSGGVIWKTEKTGREVTVYYDYVAASNFAGEGSKGKNPEDSRKDEVFLRFTDEMTNKIKPKSNTNNNDENKNLYTKAVMKYLADDDKYIKSMPYLTIDNIYIINLETGFLLSYPLTNENYKPDADFQSRPWYNATKNKYGKNYFQKDDNGRKTALTGVYIDINDTINPNIQRTLFYTFQDEREQKYILCVDLSFDKSSQFSSKSSLDLVMSGLYLEEDNNPWVFLIPYSVILAVFLFLIYEMKGKSILLRMLNFSQNNLLKITLERNPQKTHNASSNAGTVNITITGMTGEKNESARSREAGWRVDFNQLQANAGFRQTNTQQQESYYGYQLSNDYNLDIRQQNLRYRRVEIWEVKSHELSNQKTIGHFVVTWKASDTETLDELLEIKSVYWEKNYESYLASIKLQLQEHLLTSDTGELIPVMDTNYTIHQNMPELISRITSLEKLVHNSLYLRQGRIAFSEIQTLQELYQYDGVQVKAICTIDFLKKLSDKQQLQNFFTVEVKERYFIEYNENEFRDFYNNITDDGIKSVLESSNLKIIVYTPDQVIIGGKDDFCVISVKGTPEFIAYSFTDDKYHNIGWISWREVDVQFYNELYQAKIDQEGRINNIQNYLNGI
ncbi:hypothetical protein H6F32_17215 [Anabaena sp. FACHB-1237]|uniref:hypothetical protein n=1 Tax=Anabaena sp. FACHB-1237 TaxID=2692769 RepID=UPI0016804B70|nr:hypothetical protein [Anabaena sp. FACHB-1237]MBD2139267.1 hypothetical protein [Anabaena sp. FACHB-1237]